MLVVEEELRQGAGQLGLANTGGTEKHEAAERLVRILQARARAPDRIRHRDNRRVLPDDALVQPAFHLNQLLDFTLDQPADGNVRPLADDLGDVFFVDLFLQHPMIVLQGGEPLLFSLDLAFDLRGAAVLQLGGAGVVAGALRPLDILTERFLILFQLSRTLNRLLFLLPVARETVAILLQIGQLFLEPLEPLLRGPVGFLAQRLALDLELHDAAFQFVELGRHRVDFHPQLRGRFVDQVDGFVGKEPVADVAMREHGGGNERGILDLHAVMDLVPFAEAAQDADGVLDARLVHRDGLEPAFERRVLLDVFPILVQRGRANRVELAAGEHRLQHVRCIHRSLGRAGADHGVELVDEEDHLSLRIANLLEHGLQPLFELPTVFRAGDQGAHVERHDAFVLQALRHVAPHDAAGEPFDNGGLAHARLANEHRVVLGPAREDLDHAPDFLVAADHGIELALAGERGEIAAIALERLIRTLGILARDALRPANARERLKDLVGRDAVLLEQPGGRRPTGFRRDGDEQVFRADVLVLEPSGFSLRRIADQLETW